MRNYFKVTVNDQFSFDISEEEARGFDAVSLGKDAYHLLHQNQSLKAHVTHKNFDQKSYEVELSGGKYQVKIGTSLDQLIQDMGLSASVAKSINQVRAPMPGLILEVLVGPGQEVKEGDYLLVLEAMKMENTLTAPRDGVVKSLNVEKGQTVEKNQLLLDLD